MMGPQFSYWEWLCLEYAHSLERKPDSAAPTLSVVLRRRKKGSALKSQAARTAAFCPT